MEACRFISVGESYGAGMLRIDRSGFETDDARLIAFLRQSPDYGVFFYEVASRAVLQEERIQDAIRVLNDAGLLETPPVEAGEAAEELAAVAEQAAIRAAQEAAAEAAAAAKREAREKAYAAHKAKKAGK